MSAAPDGRDKSPLRSIDPALEWALWSDFEFIATDGRVGLLVEWRNRDGIREAERLLPKGTVVARAYLEQKKKAKSPRRFWALTVPQKLVGQFLEQADHLALRIELAAPVVTPQGISTAVTVAPTRPAANTLLAVLDDGCSFANRRFRYTEGTRILWLWDQDPDAAGPLPMGKGPTALADFGYGGEFSQSDLDAIYPALHSNPDDAYREAGLVGLRRRAVHGTHVMDLLAGREPKSGTKSDIVFIQFPQSGIDDPSGRWLARYVLDGLIYVIESAAATTKQIVANVSWGPQTGPHDGHSLLEDAIQELVDEQAALGRALVVTVPAGNSFGSQAHACISYATGGTFDWVVPPDGEVPTFLELWWPPGVPPALALVTITPPHGAPVQLTPLAAVHPDGTWWARLKTVGAFTRAVLVVHPTDGGQGINRGPHGAWRIHVLASPAGVGDVHAYVSRADHNMNARRRAKASRLTDGGLARARFRAAADRFLDPVNSVVKGAGTLNGIAGFYTPPVNASVRPKGIAVAAGYDLRTGEPTPYSSAGPTRGQRTGPDYAFVTDRSPARPGVAGAGVRSGTRFHLIGTSAAAPQLGRLLASAVKPMLTASDPARVGLGEVPPEPEIAGPD